MDVPQAPSSVISFPPHDYNAGLRTGTPPSTPLTPLSQALCFSSCQIRGQIWSDFSQQSMSLELVLALCTPSFLPYRIGQKQELDPDPENSGLFLPWCQWLTLFNKTPLSSNNLTSAFWECGSPGCGDLKRHPLSPELS